MFGIWPSGNVCILVPPNSECGLQWRTGQPQSLPSGAHWVEGSGEKSGPLDYSQNSKEVLRSGLLSLLRNCLLFSSLNHYLQNWFFQCLCTRLCINYAALSFRLGEFFSCIVGPHPRHQGIPFTIILHQSIKSSLSRIPSESFIMYKGVGVRGLEMGFICHSCMGSLITPAFCIRHMSPTGNFQTPTQWSKRPRTGMLAL